MNEAEVLKSVVVPPETLHSHRTLLFSFLRHASREALMLSWRKIPAGHP